MKKNYFLLVASFGIFCLSPIAAQSQEKLHSGSVTLIAQEQPASPVSNEPSSPAAVEENVPAASGEQNVETAPASESPAQSLPESTQPTATPPATAGETTTETTPQPAPTVAGLYAQLEQELNGQKWQQADQTTYELMLLVAGPKSAAQGYFDTAEWNSFSCEEFKRIDSLWSKATQGQQGFTAQLNIYREANDSSTYFERIGWKKDGRWLVRWEYDRDTKRVEYLPGMQPNFTQPPAGHLPALMQWGRGEDYRLQKAASCSTQ